MIHRVCLLSMQPKFRKMIHRLLLKKFSAAPCRSNPPKNVCGNGSFFPLYKWGKWLSWNWILLHVYFSALSVVTAKYFWAPTNNVKKFVNLSYLRVILENWSNRWDGEKFSKTRNETIPKIIIFICTQCRSMHVKVRMRMWKGNHLIRILDRLRREVVKKTK